MSEKVGIKLEKLVLRNYKGFYTGEDEDGVEITFDEHLTVFIGDNGSGKSAVLDAIALFLVKLRSEISNIGETASIYPFPMPSKERKNKAVNNQVEETAIEILLNLFPKYIKDYVYEKETKEEVLTKFDDEGNKKYDKEGNLEKISVVEARTHPVETKRKPLVGFSIYMEKDKSPSTVTIGQWQDNSTNIEIKPDGDDGQTLERFLKEYIHEPYSLKKLDHIPMLAYYGANSITINLSLETEEVDTSIFDTYRDALDANKFSFNQFFVWYDDQQKRSAQSLLENKSDISKMKFIATAISLMLDDDNNGYKNLKINWFVTPNEMAITKYNKQTKKEEDLSISQLSSGEKTLIALVGDITRRLCLANPNSENPLEGNGIALIDEIDVHLHPKWQRKIIPKLRAIFPNIQFVITTHSPYVISSTEPHNIRILTEDTSLKKKIILNAAEENKHTKGLEPNRILKEIMGAPLRDFDTQKKVAQLSQMIKTNWKNPEIAILIEELTNRLGIQDPFIMRVQHELLMLKRRKTPAT